MRLIQFEAEVGETFTIEDMYAYEPRLAKRYPENHHIRETIRDKLQELRDEGIIRFLGDGVYLRLR
jgi:type II restriction enzyme